MLRSGHTVVLEDQTRAVEASLPQRVASGITTKNRAGQALRRVQFRRGDPIQEQKVMLLGWFYGGGKKVMP